MGGLCGGQPNRKTAAQIDMALQVDLAPVRPSHGLCQAEAQTGAGFGAALVTAKNRSKTLD